MKYLFLIVTIKLPHRKIGALRFTVVQQRAAFNYDTGNLNIKRKGMIICTVFHFISVVCFPLGVLNPPYSTADYFNVILYLKWTTIILYICLCLNFLTVCADLTQNFWNEDFLIDVVTLNAPLIWDVKCQKKKKKKEWKKLVTFHVVFNLNHIWDRSSGWYWSLSEFY